MLYIDNQKHFCARFATGQRRHPNDPLIAAASVAHFIL